MKTKKEEFNAESLKEDYKFLSPQRAGKLERFFNIFLPVMFFGILIGLAVFITIFQNNFHSLLEAGGYLK